MGSLLFVCGYAAIACLVACSGTKTETTRGVHHEYDALLTPPPSHPHDDVMPVLHSVDRERVGMARAALAHDDRADVRLAAIYALRNELLADAVADVVPALDDPDPAVALAAAEIIAEDAPGYTSRPADEGALSALRKHAAVVRAMLADPSGDTRARAVGVLAAIGDRDAPLARLVGDSAAEVRERALRLGETRATFAPDEVDALQALAAGDPDDHLRRHAVDLVLAKAPEKAAVATAMAALARGDLDDGAAYAIGERRLAAAIPALIGYLRTHPVHPHMLTERDRFVSVLGSFKLPCAAPALARILDEPEEAAAALDALSAYGVPDVVAWAKAQREDVPPCAP